MSHARMSEFTDIGRASLYEQAVRQHGLRIPAAIAGAPWARSNRLSQQKSQRLAVNESC